MPDEDTVELGVMARLPSPPPSRSGDAAPPLRIRSRSTEDPGCCPRLSGKHALGGAQIGASVSIDTRAHCSWEAPRRSRWWEETATPHAAGKPTSDRDEGFRAGWGRHVAARGNKAARAGGGSGGCATTGEVALKGQAGDEAFRSRRKVSAPYVVSMLPPEAFRRRRAYKLLQDEPVGMYMLVLLLSLGFFVVSTYLLTNRFPRLFVYVQIMAFVVEGSSLPWLFNGLRGPSARTIDFWITAILLTFLGFVTAAAPRRVGRWVLRRGSADTAEDGQRALAFFAVGMLTLTVGLHALWTGATIGHPHDVFEPPDFATTPQLARAMLALGWATTYVVLSYLRAQAGQFGLERRVLLMPSIGALALCFLSLLLLLLV